MSILFSYKVYYINMSNIVNINVVIIDKSMCYFRQM